MIQTITLEKYFELGGLIEKLDLENTTMNYNSYPTPKIRSIEDAGYNNSKTSKVYKVTFENSCTATFSGIYINTRVWLNLERKYLPIKLEDKAFEMLNLLEGVLRLKDLIAYSGVVEEEHLGEAQALSEMISGIEQFVKLVK